MYIQCNFCLILHITHKDMEENASGCFFLNTVYIKNLGQKPNDISGMNKCRTVWITFGQSDRSLEVGFDRYLIAVYMIHIT